VKTEPFRCMSPVVAPLRHGKSTDRRPLPGKPDIAVAMKGTADMLNLLAWRDLCGATIRQRAFLAVLSKSVNRGPLFGIML
jgi:hypothetical protein